MDKLWVDKYRPKQLKYCEHNQQVNTLFQKLAKTDEFPHLLVYGPQGSGRRTRVMAFLSELFESQQVHRVKSEMREFKNKQTNQSTECRVVSSNYHIEVSPSECDNQDKVVVQQLIKEVGSNRAVLEKDKKAMKVVIINQGDCLSQVAQAGLRRTMEKYIEKCRIIILASNIGRIIMPLKSRCLMVRVACPNNNEIEQVLQSISDKENLQISRASLESIIKNSERNLRRAIIMLQQYKMYSSSRSHQNYSPELPLYRQAISNIASEIVTSKNNVQSVKKLREMFYDLIVNCVPSDMIVRWLMMDVMEYLDEQQKIKVIQIASDIDGVLEQGQKHIFFLESFAIRLMMVVKGIQEQMESLKL